MSLRDQIAAAALLGSGQQLDWDPTGCDLEPLLKPLQERNEPQRTLDAVALITAYEEAGATPLSGTQHVSVSEQDLRPPCSSVAIGHLTALLVDRRPLLPEWLGLLNKAGLRPTEEFVPLLLDAASTDRPIREGVLAATGPLGLWLSQFREQWSWVHAETLNDAIWETGTVEERFAMLRQLRSTDPSGARKLAMTTWMGESSDTKRLCLEALSVNASLEDEAFLEGALDDRSIVVRRTAAERLAGIVGSKLNERMLQRLSGRLRLSKTGLLGLEKVIDVTPFEELDVAMMRDGIEKKPPAASTLGERAWWTAQALGCVDPSAWNRMLSLDPEKLLDAARKGQWLELLMEGWRTAAVRHRSVKWLHALAGEAPSPSVTNAAIFRALPANDREQVMLRLLSKDARAWLGATPTCCSHAWSGAFTSKVLACIQHNLPKDPTDPFHFQVKPLLRACAHFASPEAQCDLTNEVFDEFADVLFFRRSMRQALQSKEMEEKEK